MAKPTEDSVAERTKMKNTKIYPTISSKYNENVIKLRFIDNNNISRDIIVFKMFPRFNTKPSIPMWKSTIAVPNK